MYGLYQSLRDELVKGPTDIVPVSTLMEKQALNWRQILLNVCGCHFFAVLPHADPTAHILSSFHLFSDAALEGAPNGGGLGGYFHGFWWTLTLNESWKRIPIPHLEMAGGRHQHNDLLETCTGDAHTLVRGCSVSGSSHRQPG